MGSALHLRLSPVVCNKTVARVNTRRRGAAWKNAVRATLCRHISGPRCLAALYEASLKQLAHSGECERYSSFRAPLSAPTSHHFSCRATGYNCEYPREQRRRPALASMKSNRFAMTDIASSSRFCICRCKYDKRSRATTSGPVNFSGSRKRTVYHRTRESITVHGAHL